MGNNSIGNYDYLSTYASGYSYPFGGKLASGTVSTLSTDLLEWETTTSFDVGLEFATLKNRLTFEADYYDKQTDGILYKAPVYATIGNKSAPYQNLCGVSNRGFEFTIGWRDQVKNFRYIPGTNKQAEFTIAAGMVTTESKVVVPVVEVKAPYVKFLDTVTFRQEVINLIKAPEVVAYDKYPGIKFGAMEGATNEAGNWE